MSNFDVFAQKVNDNFQKMAEHTLVVTDLDPEILYNCYLSSFPKGTDPIYINRTEHTCSCCHSFFRQVGNVIGLTNKGQFLTLWDGLEDLPYPYDVVARSLKRLTYNNIYQVYNLFLTDKKVIGNQQTKQFTDKGTLYWDHFFAEIPEKFRAHNVDEISGEYRTTANMLYDTFENISKEAVDIVIDLIQSNSLYRGEQYLESVVWLKSVYERNYFPFMNWFLAKEKHARIKNTAIGKLLQDITTGMDIEKAVISFETIVAPANYKRSSAPITQKMIEQASETIKELGIEDSLKRRQASLSDISITNVIWANNKAESFMKDSLVDLLKDSIKPRTITESKNKINILQFIEDVLPTAQEVSLFVDNKYLKNLVTLTTSEIENSPNIFKWDNSFAWSYKGDVTDSLKERVKNAGGNTEAPLRVSLGWFNGDDLDIHCSLPNGSYVYYGSKQGILDVDMNAGSAKNDKDPVENLSWSKPLNGTYTIYVNQYQKRSNIHIGFELQIQCGSKIINYSYPKVVNGKIPALTFNYQNGEITSIKAHDDLVTSGASTSTDWGITSQQFVNVNSVLRSPNFWDGNSTGLRHFFFILEGCKPTDPIRGFYTEFLNSDLEKHKKVFEVLGSKTMCQPSEETENQLSGLGFSSVSGNELHFNVVHQNGQNKTYSVTI